MRFLEGIGDFEQAERFFFLSAVKEIGQLFYIEDIWYVTQLQHGNLKRIHSHCCLSLSIFQIPSFHINIKNSIYKTTNRRGWSVLFSAISAKLKCSTSYSNIKRYIFGYIKYLKVTGQVEFGASFGGAANYVFTVTYFISSTLPELRKLKSICLWVFILYLTCNQFPL